MDLSLEHTKYVHYIPKSIDVYVERNLNLLEIVIYLQKIKSYLNENKNLKNKIIKKANSRKKRGLKQTYTCPCGMGEYEWVRFKRCRMCHNNAYRYCSLYCYKKYHKCDKVL